MSHASPIIPFPPGLGPSSPPHTPTAPSPRPFFHPKISSGPGSGLGGFTPPIPPASLSQPHDILPLTSDHTNYSHPFRTQELSPYSSNASDANVSEQEPELSDDNSRSGSASPSAAQQARDDATVSHAQGSIRGNWTIEELSDFDENDMEGRTDIIHPTTIEYAESERPIDGLLDSHVINDFENLKCRSPDLGFRPDDSEDSDLNEDVLEARVKLNRERERRHRMSKSSGTKRTRSERGSDDSDYEDVRNFIGFEEAGSCAGRLRKRVAGDRRSLVFQDPPPKIDEMVEPEELETAQTLAKELPFYEYTSMEVDSPRSP